MIIIINDNNSQKQYDLDSFGKEVISFGRSEDCDIKLDSAYVSRLHGCFYLENNKWNIKDLESTNGIRRSNVLIDEEPIRFGSEYEIKNSADTSQYVSIAAVKVMEIVPDVPVGAGSSSTTSIDGFGPDPETRTTLIKKSAITGVIVVALAILVVCGLIIWNKKGSKDQADSSTEASETDATEVICALPAPSDEDVSSSGDASEEKTTDEATTEKSKEEKLATQGDAEDKADKIEDSSEESSNDQDETTEQDLTEEEKNYLEAVKKYCYAQYPDLDDLIEKGYNITWKIYKPEDAKDYDSSKEYDYDYEVEYLSYTGSRIYYQIHTDTGEVTTEERDDNISSKRMKGSERFNINDYMD